MFKLEGCGITEPEQMNCWEFLNCPEEDRTKCEAFKRDFGKECWLMINDSRKKCPHYKKYCSCVACPWFKKLNPELAKFSPASSTE